MLFDTDNRKRWIDSIKEYTGETDDVNVIIYSLSFTLQSLRNGENMKRYNWTEDDNSSGVIWSPTEKELYDSYENLSDDECLMVSYKVVDENDEFRRCSFSIPSLLEIRSEYEVNMITGEEIIYVNFADNSRASYFVRLILDDINFIKVVGNLKFL